MASTRENPQILKALSNSGTLLISIFLHLISLRQFHSVDLTNTENSAKHVEMLLVLVLFVCLN